MSKSIDEEGHLSPRLFRDLVEVVNLRIQNDQVGKEDDINIELRYDADFPGIIAEVLDPEDDNSTCVLINFGENYSPKHEVLSKDLAYVLTLCEQVLKSFESDFEWAHKKIDGELSSQLRSSFAAKMKLVKKIRDQVNGILSYAPSNPLPDPNLGAGTIFDPKICKIEGY